jgi:predicted site-specific integrase-resolvase
MTTDTHLTPSAAARILEVSARTVDRYGDAGLLHALQTPYGRLFERDEVERLRQEREAKRRPVAA